MCEELGRVTAATVVDHIEPVSLGGSMWDSKNHQALCDPCHNSIKQRLDAKLRKNREHS